MTRLVHRRGPGRYDLVPVENLRWVPAHTDERQLMAVIAWPLDTAHMTTRKVKVPDTVRILSAGGGSLAHVTADRLDEYLRRPSSRAMARIEAAEAALTAARAELAAAKKAAFAYGKAIPLSTVKAASRDAMKEKA